MAPRASIAPHAVDCDAAHAMMCALEAPGHAAYPMQERIASATPRQWEDAIVASIEADGWVGARTLDDGELVRVWRHGGFPVVVGEPVAVHRVAALVAVVGETTSAVIR